MPSIARAYVLKNYRTVAELLGQKPDRMLRAVGLQSSVLDSLDTAVPFDALAQLLENTAIESGCDTVGLRLAEKHELDDFGIISLLARHQRTLRDMLSIFIDYRHILTQSHMLYLDTAGKTTVIREEFMTDKELPTRQVIEMAVGMAFRMCDEISERMWKPLSVNFRHPAPADRSLHERIFRCKVNFSADFNGIVCDTASLDADNPKADPAIVRAVSQIVGHVPEDEQAALVFAARKMVYLLMPIRRATIEQVAMVLGMSVSTLQRRLKSSKLTFIELLNAVRREMALPYLRASGHTLQRISDLLGFANQSSFTRWFVAEFSVTPRAWRQQHNVSSARIAVRARNTLP